MFSSTVLHYTRATILEVSIDIAPPTGNSLQRGEILGHRIVLHLCFCDFFKPASARGRRDDGMQRGERGVDAGSRSHCRTRDSASIP